MSSWDPARNKPFGVAKKTPWVTLKVPAANPVTDKLGNAFLTDYLLPFEIASIVLLVALVGAVVVARHQVRGELR